MKTALILIAVLFAIAQSQSIVPGTYRIDCPDGNVFDIKDSGMADGTPLITGSWHNGLNQHFIVEYVDGVWATMYAQHSHKFLTVSSPAVGAIYTQEEKIGVNGAWTQQFRFEATTDGFTRVINRDTGKVMTCPAGKNPVQGNKVCDPSEKLTFELQGN